MPVLTKLNSLDIIQFGKYSFRFEGPEATPQIAAKPLQGPSGRKAVTVRKGTSTKSKPAETPKKSSSIAQSRRNERVTQEIPIPDDTPSKFEDKQDTNASSTLESAIENGGHLVPLTESDAPSLSVIESETPSLETDTSVNTSAADIEVVNCGHGEDSDDGEIFLSQQPVKTPKSILSPTKSPSPSKKLNSPKETTTIAMNSNSESTSPPKSPSAFENTTPYQKDDLSEESIPKTASTVAPKSAGPALSKSLRTASKLRQSHKKTIPSVVDSKERRTLRTGPISRQASHTTSFSELPFVDDMDRSVSVDDEGSQPLQASRTTKSAKKPTSSSGPKLSRKTRQRSKSSRNDQPSDYSDIELDPPVPKKKKIVERDSKPTAATYLGVAPPKSIIPASVHFSPPLEGAGYQEQQKHIIRSILKAEQGPLTHRQIMQVARSHEPYAEALRKGTKGNWKVELEAAAGNLNFMPELIRHRGSVNLPL